MRRRVRLQPLSIADRLTAIIRTAPSTSMRGPGAAPTQCLIRHRHIQMNAIVLVALRRPLTFVVMSILIILFGAMAVLKTPTDIFPAIRVPVIAVVWNYNGLSPQDMSGRVVYYYERALTATVANIEHVESESLYGTGVVKIFF